MFLFNYTFLHTYSQNIIHHTKHNTIYAIISTNTRRTAAWHDNVMTTSSVSTKHIRVAFRCIFIFDEKYLSKSPLKHGHLFVCVAVYSARWTKMKNSFALIEQEPLVRSFKGDLSESDGNGIESWDKSQ